MSKVWLKKWKEYTNYAYIKKNVQYSYYYSQYNKVAYSVKLEAFPGPIENSSILVPLDEFLNDGDTKNPENQVIRHDLNQRDNIKIVNKKIWDFFFEKYQGGPVIKKHSIEEKQRYSNMPKKIIELYYRKVII